MNKGQADLKKAWEQRCQQLVGRRISAVTYMSEEEKDTVGWSRAAIVIELDDGTSLYPSRDDEGNDSGSMKVHQGPLCDKVPGTIPSI